MGFELGPCGILSLCCEPKAVHVPPFPVGHPMNESVVAFLHSPSCLPLHIPVCVQVTRRAPDVLQLLQNFLEAGSPFSTLGGYALSLLLAFHTLISAQFLKLGTGTSQSVAGKGSWGNS